MAYRILSLSGGGIRGIFQAVYLREVAKHLQKPLRASFDLIAGTSTGALIAFAVALDIDLDRVVNLFRERGATIFNPRWCAGLRKGPRYREEPLRNALKEIFGEHTLSDCAPVVIAATKLDQFGHRVFTTLEDPGGIVQDAHLPVVDVAMATCAAPTYFSPVKPAGQERTYVDGGMWANTPSLLAVMEAHRRKGILFSDMCLISIGNGEFPAGAVPKDFKTLRPLSPKSVLSLFDMMFAGQMTSADDFAEALVGTQNMLRVNVQLDEFISLDDVVASCDKLPPRAEEAAATSVRKFQEFASRTGEPRAKTDRYMEWLDSLWGTGIRRIHEERYIRRVYQEYQRVVSKNLDLLGMGLQHFYEDVVRDGQILRWVIEREQLHVRILLLDPQSAYCSARDREEGDHEGYIAEGSIRLTEKILELNHPRIGVGWYNVLPTTNIFRLDQILFVGPYLIGQRSRQTPTLELDIGGPLAQQYLRHFDDLWDPKNGWSSRPTGGDVAKAKAYLTGITRKGRAAPQGNN